MKMENISPVKKYINENIDSLSAEKIRELLEDENRKQAENEHHRQIYDELDRLIKQNQQSIDKIEASRTINDPFDDEFFDPFNREPDKSHKYFGFNFPAIEEHLKTITPRDALSYLIELDIEYGQWVTLRPEGGLIYPGGLKYLIRKEIEYLKADNVEKYVHLELSAAWARTFKFKIDRLKREYKKRIEVPEHLAVNEIPAEDNISGFKEYSWKELLKKTFGTTDYKKYGGRFRKCIKRSSLWEKEIKPKPRSRKLIAKPSVITKIQNLIKDPTLSNKKK